MSNNPNETAFPAKREYTSSVGTREFDFTNGLTKREWFIGMAMQGMITRHGLMDGASTLNAIRTAIIWADLTLRQMEVEP